MRKIGLVGRGYVGEALYRAFSKIHHVEIYDSISEKRTVQALDELAAKTDSFIFLCLPTPMKRSGECSLEIIKSVLSVLECAAPGRKVCIKSTMPPGSTKYLASLNPRLHFTFNPEFLSERTYIQDFQNQKTVVIGSDDESDGKELEAIFKETLPQVEVLRTTTMIAEFVKYMSNTFLATKISWANEMADMCEKAGVSYKEAIGVASRNDTRLGTSHFDVPGHDGEKGFGGSCLPKDINAMIYFARQIGVWPSLLLGVWDRNLEVRPEKDWEQLKGRSVECDLSHLENAK